MKFSGKVDMGQWTVDWILVAIWITGKSCLGRGMHCPTALQVWYCFVNYSSCNCILNV